MYIFGIYIELTLKINDLWLFITQKYAFQDFKSTEKYKVSLLNHC